jgi:glutathione peroxidase
LSKIPGAPDIVLESKGATDVLYELRCAAIAGIMACAAVINPGPAGAATGQSAHEFAFTSIEGKPLSMEQFAGKVVLVVNTASRCGFTPQYKGLQTLWEIYRDQGLVILGVPSGDFGNQELSSSGKIKEFCEVNFAIDFPLTERTEVSGGSAHPFYVWASRELGAAAKPRWNFHKYLVGKDGRLITWFSTTTGPSSERVQTAIEAALTE